MKNVDLANINFREIVNYGGQPVVQSSYHKNNPLQCQGYCIDCEKKGIASIAGVAGGAGGSSGGYLDLMSHGCDSSDFIKVLGPMPQNGPPIDVAVLFLLEDPGADYGNGKVVPYQGYFKQPPVYHYYFLPHIKTWPQCFTQIGGEFYGPYFAYLMYHHQLTNVYITNIAKCKLQASNNKAPVFNHCISKHLNRELANFSPKLALCFGKKVEGLFREITLKNKLSCKIEYLYHPAFIQFRSQTIRETPESLVNKNDERIKSALNGL